MDGLWKALTEGFMPHGFCLHWDVPLLATFIAGNIGIAVAYFMIPVALRHFAGKRKDLPYPFMFQLFAAFITACGISHLAKIWTIWQPAYWIEAAIDVGTALVSLLTALMLFPIIPKMLALRSPKELEELNRNLKEEIVVRIQAEQAAETARDRAIRADKLKSQFVANVSHEIRTPMSGVIGLAELLSEAPELTPENREVAETMFDSCKQLLMVLNDLLDFSKLEAGRLELEKHEFSVKALINEVKELIEVVANKKGLELTTSVDPRIPELLNGDSVKIRQILLNLVHNAIKFTPQGTVGISAELREGEGRLVKVRFAVTDTGIGIPTYHQQQLFEPFVQGDATTKRSYGGTGLGLSISKGFIDLLGGEIGLTSEPDKGSTFWLVVPLETGSTQS